jgi:hypothetical protein
MLEITAVASFLVIGTVLFCGTHWSSSVMSQGAELVFLRLSRPAAFSRQLQPWELPATSLEERGKELFSRQALSLDLYHARRLS